MFVDQCEHQRCEAFVILFVERGAILKQDLRRTTRSITTTPRGELPQRPVLFSFCTDKRSVGTSATEAKPFWAAVCSGRSACAGPTPTRIETMRHDGPGVTSSRAKWVYRVRVSSQLQQLLHAFGKAWGQESLESTHCTPHHNVGSLGTTVPFMAATPRGE